jgi:hypothetical protein
VGAHMAVYSYTLMTKTLCQMFRRFPKIHRKPNMQYFVLVSESRRTCNGKTSMLMEEG